MDSMIMEHLKYFNKLMPRVNITYRCNMFSYCKYCYSKEELKKYKKDMKIKDFQKIIKWFKEAYDIENVAFLGGESSIHPNLEEFGEILNSKKIGCFMFSNGCFQREKLDIIKKIKAFHTIFFHYEPEILNNSTFREKFLTNLDALSKNKKIVFRYNTGNPNFDFKELIDLSKKYNASVAYSFTSPAINKEIEYIKINDMKKFVPQLMKFIEEAHKNNIDLLNKRPLPLCIFDDNDIDVAKKIGGLRCVCCVGSVGINPDLSLIAAPTLTTIKTSPPKNEKDLIEKVERLQKKIDDFKWKNPTIPECVNCKFWENHECQGSCTVYKLVN